MENDLISYNEIRKEAEDFYQNLGSIFSPALCGYVRFSAEGFNHILFKNPRSGRDQSSQKLRFKVLPLAVKLLTLSTTYQEFEERTITLEGKKCLARYWGIIAIIENKKIKIVLRKIGDQGILHFWSVIPDWMTSKERDLTFFGRKNYGIKTAPRTEQF